MVACSSTGNNCARSLQMVGARGGQPQRHRVIPDRGNEDARGRSKDHDSHHPGDGDNHLAPTAARTTFLALTPKPGPPRTMRSTRRSESGHRATVAAAIFSRPVTGRRRRRRREGRSGYAASGHRPELASPEPESAPATTVRAACPMPQPVVGRPEPGQVPRRTHKTDDIAIIGKG